MSIFQAVSSNIAMLLLAFSLGFGLSGSLVAAPPESLLSAVDDSTVILGDADSILESLFFQPYQAASEERPMATEERPRGVAADVYPQVAPTVVLVSTNTGHGTGFLISKDGWLLTNAHVVCGARFDHVLKANVVPILVGELGDDGWMRESDDRQTAIVYRVSERRDLAILKLTELPKGASQLPFLTLAKSEPTPGQDCVVIGHPGIGALWSVRQGQLTGVGQFPGDRAGTMASLLQLSAEERRGVEQEMAKHPEQKRVLQSNCVISSGDSGGPLVNSEGQLVGVTFAVRSALESGVAAAFSLHVHLSEVRDFIASLPKHPEPMIPGTYMPLDIPASPIHKDEDGRPDGMVFRPSSSAPPLGLQIVLRPRSTDAVTIKGTKGKVNKLSARRIPNWRPHFSIYAIPALTVVYDINADGSPDLVFRDEDDDHIAETRYQFDGDELVISKTKDAAVDGSHFENADLAHAFEVWRRGIAQLLSIWQRLKSE
ncbi:S1 family peptidase [Rubinisphaera brasiliensis]|uniref:Peptidase S1 and S6 chymotrypsin/Hap n=1 Tax=Rubinisphaera brasiliensis (strain ATCC 49424 / DSM 5305 / JCM 21570 / IAM 15109 / NBRC 103401 / IFAM 1448) TaxID=756272 RepID=F0SR50_RUBBR|nr:serine protease [Rubinisphaera brasiliensis]ADY61297.1 peptidase S1 and S6 chymotrypsin/Hap [Rubinisphaera brasiliensis DSM 5305]